MNPQLQQEIEELGPWHLEVEVAPGITTKGDAPSSTDGISLISPRPDFRGLIRSVFPEGFGGRAFLDCACNCGGYSFWARELGAGRCFGFDVREHWIRQANILLEHRGDGDMAFETKDLYALELEDDFDVTLFKGIFYHLPDPITGLKLIADRTKEVLILNTATASGKDEDVLVIGQESVEHPMSGVHGLNWFPGGPKVLKEILCWVGFPETHVRYWLKKDPAQPDSLARTEIIAARDPATLENIPA